MIISEFNQKLESIIDFIKERVGATNISLEKLPIFLLIQRQDKELLMHIII